MLARVKLDVVPAVNFGARLAPRHTAVAVGQLTVLEVAHTGVNVVSKAHTFAAPLVREELQGGVVPDRR